MKWRSKQVTQFYLTNFSVKWCSEQVTQFYLTNFSVKWRFQSKLHNFILWIFPWKQLHSNVNILFSPFFSWNWSWKFEKKKEKEKSHFCWFEHFTSKVDILRINGLSIWFEFECFINTHIWCCRNFYFHKMYVTLNFFEFN